jgi:hypothetical protein
MNYPFKFLMKVIYYKLAFFFLLHFYYGKDGKRNLVKLF